MHATAPLRSRDKLSVCNSALTIPQKAVRLPIDNNLKPEDAGVGEERVQRPPLD
jgi:hypothetical protein